MKKILLFLSFTLVIAGCNVTVTPTETLPTETATTVTTSGEKCLFNDSAYGLENRTATFSYPCDWEVTNHELGTVKSPDGKASFDLFDHINIEANELTLTKEGSLGDFSTKVYQNEYITIVKLYPKDENLGGGNVFKIVYEDASYKLTLEDIVKSIELETIIGTQGKCEVGEIETYVHMGGSKCYKPAADAGQTCSSSDECTYGCIAENYKELGCEIDCGTNSAVACEEVVGTCEKIPLEGVVSIFRKNEISLFCPE